MNIGIVKERKKQEYRVGLSDHDVARLVAMGHHVFVEEDAGIGAGFSNESYVQAGATICSREQVWEQSLIIKVKEPIEEEYPYLKEHQTLFTYLHLASDQPLLDELLRKHITAFAYETLQEQDGSLPLLAPMSDVAGRVAFILGCYGQRMLVGGNGILPMSIPQLEGANILVLGCGRVGASAADAAMVLGNHVTIFERRVAHAKALHPHLVSTCQWISTEQDLHESYQKADVVICAILTPGGKAEQLITKDILKTMKKGSVIIDVSIDQGGTIEGFHKITTHEQPFEEYEGMIVCTIANLPGIYPKTSSRALHAKTMPYIEQLVRTPINDILKDPILSSALNTYEGKNTYEAVANAFGYPYTKITEIM